MAIEVRASMAYLQLEPMYNGRSCTPDFRLDYQGELGEYHVANSLKLGDEDARELTAFLQTNRGYRVILNLGLQGSLESSKNIFQLDGKRRTQLMQLVESHNQSLDKN